MTALPFPSGEFLARISAAKARMESDGIEVLLVVDPANMYYLSGYDATSYYVPQALIVALDEEEPLWVGRAMDAACARLTVFMDEAHIVGYPEYCIGDPDRHGMSAIGDLVRERGRANRRLATEMDAVCFTPRALRALEQALPDARIADAGSLVNRLRLIKSDQEVEYVRQAGQLADRAMEAAIAAIAPGVRESAVAATVYDALIRGTAEFGGEPPDTPIISAGPRAAAPHLIWTDEPYRTGEATNLELGGCRRRYHCGLSRTIFLGQPPAKLEALAPAVIEGMAVALDSARAGSTCEEVEASWRRAIGAHGYEKPSRIGYSIGIGYAGLDWNERSASLKPGDTTILQPNMVFHLMLGMWMEDWGFVLSETFRVTDSGAPETFSRMPRQLFAKS